MAAGTLRTVLGNVLVQFLHAVVVAQQVQALAVGLPEELDPGDQHDAIGARLGVLPAYSAQQETVNKASKRPSDNTIFYRNVD